MAPGLLIDDDFRPAQLGYKSAPATINGALPPRWPSTLSGELVWAGSDFKSPSDYTLKLTVKDIEEIIQALDHFREHGLDGDEIQPELFPLPQLSKKLRDCAEQVHLGKGFVNIRGLDPASFSVEENAMIFLAISSYIGEHRGKQDEDGNMMMHLYDVKETHTPQAVRPLRYSQRASTYHTDTFCDILALQTRSNAASGGRHSLASSWTVYNQMASTRPDLVSALSQPNWHFDSRSKLIGSNSRPLLFYEDNRVILNFAREPLVGVKGVARDSSLPELSPLQLDALGIIERYATANQLTLDLQPGDMTFINNHALLHTRETFQDSEQNKRHIVRLWLQNQRLAWKLPTELQHGNSRIYGENEIDEVWNVAPAPRLAFSLSERLCS